MRLSRRFLIALAAVSFVSISFHALALQPDTDPKKVRDTELPPDLIRLCTTSCVDLKYDDWVYHAIPDRASSDEYQMYMFDSFKVVLLGKDATILGKISASGNRLDDCDLSSTEKEIPCNVTWGSAVPAVPTKPNDHSEPVQENKQETSDTVDPHGYTNGLITVTLPPKIRYCAGRCFTLELNNGKYDAYQEGAPHVVNSTFTVYRFTPQMVIMTMVQTKGGATGVLKGSMSADETSLIDAIFTWTNVPYGSGVFHMSWGNALASARPVTSDESSAFLATGASAGGHITATLPAVIRTCGVNCFKLRLNNGHYEAVVETDPSSKIKSIYTVLEFKPESVVLHRADIGGGESVLTGRISSKGDSIVGGMIKGSNPAYGAFPYQMSWGDSLMATTRFGVPLYGPQCTLSTPLTDTAEVAYNNGLDAWKRRDFAQLYCWAKKSADRGNGQAMTLLAIAYDQGAGVQHDSERSFEFLQQAAAKGDPRGEYLLSLNYKDRPDTPSNRERASFWMNKAMTTDEGRAIDAEIKREAQETYNQQQLEAGRQEMLGQAFMWLLDMVDSDDHSSTKNSVSPMWGIQANERNRQAFWAVGKP